MGNQCSKGSPVIVNKARVHPGPHSQGHQNHVLTKALACAVEADKSPHVASLPS